MISASREAVRKLFSIFYPLRDSGISPNLTEHRYFPRLSMLLLSKH